jgi:chemotaxis signal transduction protein
MNQERWFCLFRGDAGPMAVPAESVAEVLDVDRLVRLAWSPPQVAGLCPFHREVIPVIRLAASTHDTRVDSSGESDPPAGTHPSGERQDRDDRARRILLILKADRGSWGIRSDSAWTIMSRECPEYHAPQSEGDGPVLVGNILHAGTRYGVLDTEATWHGLRSAIGRWYGLIGESAMAPSIAPGEDQREPPRTCQERTGHPSTVERT